jgi:tetratricopeptide (TPR) repeat protein
MLEGALERARDADPAARAKALNGAGTLAMTQGDYGAARTFFDEALALLRELDDRAAAARALSNLGSIEAMEGDPDAALPLHEEAVALLRDLGEIGLLAGALNNLASVLVDTHAFTRAAAVATESADLYRQARDREGLAVALLNRGYAELEEGNLERAGQALSESLRLALPVGAAVRVLPCLTALAKLALRQGDTALSARLVGAIEAHAEATEVEEQPYVRDIAARTKSELQNALAPQEFETAIAAGRDLDIAAASELALSLVTATTPRGHGVSQGPTAVSE